MSTEIVLHVEGLEFHADHAADEPRVLDVEIGRRAGLSRPRKIRDVIRRHLASGLLNDSELRTTTVQSGGRPATEYWLTESAAVIVASRLDTAFGHALLRDMVRVYRAAVTELRAPTGVIRSAEIELVNGPRISDDCRMVHELRVLIRSASKETGRSTQAIHGALRKGIRPVSSIYLASQVHAAKLRGDLLDLLSGRWALPPAHRARLALASVTDIRQVALPFRGPGPAP